MNIYPHYQTVGVGTGKEIMPKFRDPSTLTHEQLTDPDYSIKEIARRYGQDPAKMLICSKRHHCR